MAECCRCGRRFDPSDSIGSSLDLCEKCWQTECAESFHEFCNSIAIGYANTRLVIVQTGD